MFLSVKVNSLLSQQVLVVGAVHIYGCIFNTKELKLFKTSNVDGENISQKQVFQHRRPRFL